MPSTSERAKMAGDTRARCSDIRRGRCKAPAEHIWENEDDWQYKKPDLPKDFKVFSNLNKIFEEKSFTVTHQEKTLQCGKKLPKRKQALDLRKARVTPKALARKGL